MESSENSENGQRSELSRIIKELLSGSATFLLVLLIVFILLFNRIVIFLDPGEAGVLYRLFFGGTVTDKVYHEGIQFIWPWDTMYAYNARFQEIPHKFNALTNNGLRIDFSLSIRYRPEYKLLGLLHKEVGPDYVHVVVIPEIENVLRVLVGQLDAEEVYRTKQSLVEKALSGAVDRIARRYIKVDNVILKRMQLPASVEEAVRKKVEEKHKADAYVYKLQAEEQEKERKRIEAEGLERFRNALTPDVLQYMGIEATLQLAQSANAKVVVVGGGKDGGLPIIGNMPLDFAEGSRQSISAVAGTAAGSAPPPPAFIMPTVPPLPPLAAAPQPNSAAAPAAPIRAEARQNP